jgi:hypothetical protein
MLLRKNAALHDHAHAVHRRLDSDVGGVDLEVVDGIRLEADPMLGGPVFL